MELKSHASGIINLNIYEQSSLEKFSVDDFNVHALVIIIVVVALSLQ